MTTDCHDSATPTLQDEFWGEETDWSEATTRLPQVPTPLRARVGASVRRAWGVLSGDRASADRTHAPRTHADGSAWTSGGSVRDLAEIDDLEAAWDLEPGPRSVPRPGIDPLLARIGALAVIVTLAVPVVLGFTSSPESLPTQVRTDTPAPTGAPPPAAPSTDAIGATSPEATGSERGEISPTSPTPVPDSADPSASSASASVGALVDGQERPASTADTACGSRYELAAGDYWIRIADAADVALADLLAVNGASIDTVLVPGRSICLPVGAATPAPPTTDAATPSTAASASTSRSATAAGTTPTTAAPTTTVGAPTSTEAVRPAAVSTEQAVAIIRAVWPDDLEERAIEIAWRESKHQSNVNNWCCYGLFQINWNAHRSWLASLGITSASQLYDPTANATAAYTLYQRAGGFGPWGG